MNEINFWDKTVELYINGIQCGRRHFVILAEGIQKNESKTFSNPSSNVICEKLCFFNFQYFKTLFTRKPYYSEYFGYITDGWEKLAPNNMLPEKDIESIRVDTRYELRKDSVKMKDLMDYPADLVIMYLKERGITSCPMIV